MILLVLKQMKDENGSKLRFDVIIYIYDSSQIPIKKFIFFKLKIQMNYFDMKWPHH